MPPFKSNAKYELAIKEAIKEMEALFDNMGPSHAKPLPKIEFTAADVAMLASVGMKP